ncbi:MAG: glcR [Paenibacillus sp.]|nr:glcR [Paenibacillus sp.]
MSQEERLKDIVQYLQEHGKIRVDQMCDRFGISRDSARRDLVKLEEAQLIIRTHGGAMLPAAGQTVPRYEERLGNTEGKRRIGQAAAQLIQDGESIMLNASTTVQAMAEAVTAQGITVITNSIDVAGLMGKKEGMQVHLLGGQYHPWNRSVTGAQTVEMLRNFRVNTLFLGACSLSVDGLSSPLVEESYMKRGMIRSAGRVVVLADHHKFDRMFLHHVCSLEEMDVLITDLKPPVFLQEALDRYGVQTIVTC